jgi:hypothetical protein
MTYLLDKSGVDMQMKDLLANISMQIFVAGRSVNACSGKAFGVYDPCRAPLSSKAILPSDSAISNRCCVRREP